MEYENDDIVDTINSAFQTSIPRSVAMHDSRPIRGGYSAILHPKMLGITAPVGMQKVTLHVGADKQLWAWIKGRGQVTVASTNEEKQAVMKCIVESEDVIEKLKMSIGI